MKILKEGGNVFKDPNGQIATTRINQADVSPTLAWLEKITGLDLQNNTLGTTGKAPTSGDLDVAIDQSKVTKDQLADKLNQWAIQNKQDPKLWVKKSGISVHFKTPIRGSAKNGYVQTDLMFGDPEWMKWSLQGGEPGSEYKGADRHVMMASIAIFHPSHNRFLVFLLKLATNNSSMHIEHTRSVGMPSPFFSVHLSDSALELIFLYLQHPLSLKYPKSDLLALSRPRFFAFACRYFVRQKTRK